MLQIRSFHDTPIFQIVNCFNTAFADYVIPFHVTEEAMRERWQGARVQYDLSFGAFDEQKLVGFIMTGVDQWAGKLTAYNAGTGVIPTHRGRRIVAQIYQKLIPALAKAGIEDSVLEVIHGNDKAIRAYEKVGFKKDRLVKCFQGEIKNTQAPSEGLTVVEATGPAWEAYQPLQAFTPCWDNHQNAIALQPARYRTLHLMEADQVVAYAIWRPAGQYIAQFGHRNLPDGLMLFDTIKKQSPSIRINNIDHQDQANLQLVQTIGLQNHIDQWEMTANWSS